MEWLLIIGGMLIGFGIGFIVSFYVYRPKIFGTLRVDSSDPEDGPNLFLELTANDRDAIMRSDYATFKVNTKSYISQK